jgi:hypothetical protein
LHTSILQWWHHAIDADLSDERTPVPGNEHKRAAFAERLCYHYRLRGNNPFVHDPAHSSD